MMSESLKHNIAAMRQTQQMPSFVQVLVTFEAALEEIERLRAERDDLMKANAILHALISNREAEIKQLRADKDVIRSQERNATYERDIAALAAENERLRAVLMSYASLIEQQEAEIKRLRAALKGAS